MGTTDTRRGWRRSLAGCGSSAVMGVAVALGLGARRQEGRTESSVSTPRDPADRDRG
jgi:hypothetical protein